MKKGVIIIAGTVILSGAVFGLWKISRKDQNELTDIRQKLTIEEAAKTGEMTTYKLLVIIRKPQENLEMAGKRYERGDVVLVKPADWGFSDAEKSGFLIIKMDLTPSQAEILTLSLQKGGPKNNKMPVGETLKRRKFYVDLAAIGIGNDDENGREIEGQIFKWEILKEKEN